MPDRTLVDGPQVYEEKSVSMREVRGLLHADDGESNIGRVMDVVIHPLVGFDELPPKTQGLSRVGVDVEARVVAAGDVYPYSVTNLKEVARGVGDHVKPIYPAGL